MFSVVKEVPTTKILDFGINRMNFTKSEFSCRPLAHQFVDNSGLQVFTCSQAQAIQPHSGGLLECGGLWTHVARLPCAH